MNKNDDSVGFNRLLREVEPAFENIGWTLGNDCPYRCTHCYSMQVRDKGVDLKDWMAERVVNQLVSIGIKTVNLGGNEPIFTNGLDVKNSKLPLIIRLLNNAGMPIGLTTAGITLQKLAQFYEDEMLLLNDVDISIDSPFEEEHDKNRGAKVFKVAIDAAVTCAERGIEHTLVMCGMSWNLSKRHMEGLIALARSTKSNLRINFLKPTLDKHRALFPTPIQYYEAFVFLTKHCNIIDLGEPLLSSLIHKVGTGCPCGTKSFRIHSITPQGVIPVSPCVYMHDYRVGDLLKDDLRDIIDTKQFRVFRQRRANPHLIQGCEKCKFLEGCKGGCAARAYYATEGSKTVFKKDPYCRRDSLEIDSVIQPIYCQAVGIFDGKLSGRVLVHQDYLCTLILEPK